MSNISDRHIFTSYISQGKDKSVALSGQRLSVVRFKKDKSGQKARDSQCVSVPMLTELTDEQLDSLAPHMYDWLRSVQDEIVREKCVTGADAVVTSDIEPEAIKQWLVQQSQGERLNGEQIKYWFQLELQDLLLLAFAEKLGVGDQPTAEQTKKLEQMCKVYEDCFAAMAGGRTMFDAVKRDKLIKALSLADCESGIGQKLLAKLQAMKEISVEEMLGL